jgi:predicted DNA-binding ribbon-helix-helix protein
VLVRRSLLLSGHATSVALEPEFWSVLARMAAQAGVSLPVLLVGIDQERGARSLASACRVRALAWAGQDG